MRPLLKHRLTIERQTILGTDEYDDLDLTPYAAKYTDVPCLAYPDVRPVVVLNSEVSEPDRNISRVFWTILIGKYTSDRTLIEKVLTGDRFTNVVTRRGDTVISNPVDVKIAGRQWSQGWVTVCEEHIERYDGVVP